MREFRLTTTAPKAMRHIEKRENRLFEEGKKFLKPSHSANMREFRPMPTTPKAMRRIEKRGNRLFEEEKILKPSHSANIREFRLTTTAPKVMRHIEKKEGRLFEEEKNSQTVSFREHARVPSHAHHAQSHETH